MMKRLSTGWCARRRCALSLAFLPLLLLSTCALIPKAQLERYTNAFAEVAKVTDRFIDAFVADTAPQPDAAAVALDADGLPREIDPAVIGPSALPESESVKLRRTAVAAVSRYNEVLAALAAGRSPDEVEGQADHLGALLTTLTGSSDIMSVVTSIAGTAVPGLEAGVAIVERVATLFREAQSHAEFVRAFQEGQPVVAAILSVLRQDTRDYYAARYGRFGQQRTDLSDQIDTIWEEQIKATAARYVVPGNAELAGKRAGIEREGNLLMAQTRSNWRYEAFASGSSTFTADVQALLDERLAELRQLVAARSEAVAGMQAYEEAIRSYVVLLDQTSAHLEEVRIALESPPPEEQLAELMRRADQLRLEAAGILRLLDGEPGQP